GLSMAWMQKRRRCPGLPPSSKPAAPALRTHPFRPCSISEHLNIPSKRGRDYQVAAELFWTNLVQRCRMTLGTPRRRLVVNNEPEGTEDAIRIGNLYFVRRRERREIQSLQPHNQKRGKRHESAASCRPQRNIQRCGRFHLYESARRAGVHRQRFQHP